MTFSILGRCTSVPRISRCMWYGTLARTGPWLNPMTASTAMVTHLTTLSQRHLWDQTQWKPWQSNLVMELWWQVTRLLIQFVSIRTPAPAWLIFNSLKSTPKVDSRPNMMAMLEWSVVRTEIPVVFWCQLYSSKELFQRTSSHSTWLTTTIWLIVRHANPTSTLEHQMLPS